MDDKRKKIRIVKKKRKKTLEERMNSEFKHLRKRIQKLEQEVLSGKTDNGIVGEPDTKLKKG